MADRQGPAVTRLALIALAGYTTGLALGTAVCAVAWARASHESRFKL